MVVLLMLPFSVFSPVDQTIEGIIAYFPGRFYERKLVEKGTGLERIARLQAIYTHHL